jgi:hypothetical protein
LLPTLFQKRNCGLPEIQEQFPYDPDDATSDKKEKTEMQLTKS